MLNFFFLQRHDRQNIETRGHEIQNIFFFQERTSADVKRPRGEGSSMKGENLVEAMRDFINTVKCKEESPVKDEILDVKFESGMDNYQYRPL